MRVTENLKNTVVFLGYESDGPVGAAMDCRATGFLVHHDGVGYLVTAKHVARGLGGDPFWLRLNTRRGGIGDRLYADQVDWFFHPDHNVDLACVQFHVPGSEGYQCSYLSSEEMILENPHKETANIGIGDNTYTVGLFRRMSGKTRNMPVVHCGNVAMLPSDELIPVRDWDNPQDKAATRFVEGYLIETHSIPGLSGSPVFVRSAVALAQLDGLPNLIVPRLELYLLGMWQCSWEAPPGEILTAEVGKERVPLGMGVVVPGSKIKEMLDSEEVAAHRKKQKALAAASIAATTDSALFDRPDQNPRHKEDFNSLLHAAARKRPQGDQT